MKIFGKWILPVIFLIFLFTPVTVMTVSADGDIEPKSQNVVESEVTKVVNADIQKSSETIGIPASNAEKTEDKTIEDNSYNSALTEENRTAEGKNVSVTEVSSDDAEKADDDFISQNNDNGSTSSDYEYTVSDNQVTITKYKGLAPVLNLPEEISGYTVTGIDSCAFEDNIVLTSIDIPASVYYIGSNAFAGCESLETVTFHENNGYMPGSNERFSLIIGNYAFEGCTSLTELVLPESLTGLGTGFIKDTGITTITLPQNLTETSLPLYGSIVEEVIFANGMTEIPTDVCNAYGEPSSIQTVVIPETVTDIGSWAFSECASLHEIKLPDSLRTINEYAFSGCTALSSIDIPAGVYKINDSAFYGCESLTAVTFHENNGYMPGTEDRFGLEIGVYAFSDCTSLTELILPESLIALGMGFIENTGITTITLPNNLTNASSALSGSIVEDVIFTDGMTEIPSDICNANGEPSFITTVVIPETVSKIGSWAFIDCEALSEIYFAGSEDQWNLIEKENAEIPTGTIIHFLYDPFKNDPSEDLKILVLSDDCYGRTGTQAVFHVDAQGTGGLIYQWQYKLAGTDFWKTPAQTSAKTADYVFNLKPSYDNIEVRCIVWDESGNEIISETRKANVFAYTSQPRDTIASAGETVNFEVSAIGRGVTYQWYYKRPGSTWKKTTIAGSKTPVLPITAGTINDGTAYRCVITDELGNKIISAAGILTLANTSLQVTGISEDAYDVNGKSVTFHIDAVGNGGLTYQWQYKLAGESKWRTPGQASAKTADYVFMLRPSYDNIEVRCIVTDASGNSVTSDVRKANVFAITGQPEDAELAPGEQTTFAVEAVGKDLVYQWYYMRPEGNWKKVTVAGCNTASLAITANTKNDGTKFRCRITDGLGNVLLSAAATLTQA